MFQVNPIHMKNQALFSSKDKSRPKLFKCRLLQFLFGALRVGMGITELEIVKWGDNHLFLAENCV